MIVKTTITYDIIPFRKRLRDRFAFNVMWIISGWLAWLNHDVMVHLHWPGEGSYYCGGHRR